MSIRKDRRMTVSSIARVFVSFTLFRILAFPFHMPLFNEMVANQFCFTPFTRAPVEFSHPDAHLNSILENNRLPFNFTES